MKKNKIYSIVAIFLLCVIFILLYLSWDNLKFGAKTSPDILQLDFFSDLIINNDTLSFCNNISSEEQNIFGARGLFYTRESNCFTHSSMHGHILILSLFKLIYNNTLFIINPLLSLILIFYFFKLSNLFFDKKTSLLATLLLLFSSYFIFYSVISFGNIAESLFFILATFYFIKAFKLSQKSTVYFALFFIFSGFSIWIRYSFGLIYIPFFIFLLFYKDKETKKNFFKISFIFLILISTLLYLNFYLYGNILGSAGDGKKLSSTDYFFADRPSQKIPLVQFLSFSIFTTNFIKYVIQLNTLLFLVFIISLFLLLHHKLISKRYYFLFLSILSIIFLTYLGGIWEGYLSNSILANSYSRYLLVGYIIMIFLSAPTLLVLLKKTSFSRLILMIFLILYLFINIQNAFFSHGAINQFKINQESFIDIQNNLLSIIPKESIVFTSGHDKYIFPYRITAIYTTFPQEERIKSTVTLIRHLLNKKYELFFIDDSSPNRYDIYSKEEYFNELKRNKLEVTKVNNIVYKIS